MANCGNCGHDEKKHCKGGQEHHGYKFTMRNSKDPNPMTCTTKHCEEPLCSCVDFVRTN